MAEVDGVGDHGALAVLRGKLELVKRLGAGATSAVCAAAGLLTRKAARLRGQGHNQNHTDAAVDQVRGEIEMEQIHSKGDKPGKRAADQTATPGETEIEATTKALAEEQAGSLPAEAPEGTALADDSLTDPVEAVMAEVASKATNAPLPDDAPADPLEAAETNATMETPVDPVEAALAEVESTLSTDQAEPSPPEAADPVEAAHPPQASDELAAAAVAALQGADDEIEAIASAFAQATAELDGLNDTIEQTISPSGASQPTSTEPPPTRSPADPPDQPVESVHASSRARPLPASPCSHLREEIGQIKETISSALARAEQLLDQVNQAHEQAQAALDQAMDFRQASEQTMQAARQFATTEAEAAKARAVYDQAQACVEDARRTWETAQQKANEAARQMHEPAALPA